MVQKYTGNAQQIQIFHDNILLPGTGVPGTNNTAQKKRQKMSRYVRTFYHLNILRVVSSLFYIVGGKGSYLIKMTKAT